MPFHLNSFISNICEFYSLDNICLLNLFVPCLYDTRCTTATLLMVCEYYTNPSSIVNFVNNLHVGDRQHDENLDTLL